MPSNRTVPRVCEDCGKDFLAIPYEVAKGWARFCSRACKKAFQLGEEKRPLVERFWEKVDKTPGHGPAGDCWLWIGATLPKGYGKITIQGKTISASRVSWTLHYGEIPKETPHVLHRCDNPPCVRPEHLFLGTNMDNILDRNEKGRHWRKLTPEQVVEIRILAASGHNQRALAETFGVSLALIQKIHYGTARRLG